MIYSLDTNACMALLNGRPAGVRAALAHALAASAQVSLSGVVSCELAYGAHKSARVRENMRRLDDLLAGPITLWPFDEDDARAAGAVRAALEREGTPIGAYDVMIAGQALRRQATVVTANIAEFSRVAGLALADWSNHPPT